jgi:hypothetical protein
LTVWFSTFSPLFSSFFNLLFSSVLVHVASIPNRKRCVSLIKHHPTIITLTRFILILKNPKAPKVHRNGCCTDRQAPAIVIARQDTNKKKV